MCEVATVLSAGASIVGGIMGNRAKKKEAQALDRASQLQYQQNMAAIGAFQDSINEYRSDSVWGGDVGKQAAGQVSGLLGLNGENSAEMFANMEGMADYQYMKDQMIKAGDASRSSRGGLYSSKGIIDTQRNAGNLASQYMQQYIGNRMNVANNAQNVQNTALNASGAIVGSQMDANAQRAGGSAAAAGARGQASSVLSSGITGAIGAVASSPWGDIKIPGFGGGGGNSSPTTPTAGHNNVSALGALSGNNTNGAI